MLITLDKEMFIEVFSNFFKTNKLSIKKDTIEIDCGDDLKIDYINHKILNSSFEDCYEDFYFPISKEELIKGTFYLPTFPIFYDEELLL